MTGAAKPGSSIWKVPLVVMPRRPLAMTAQLREREAEREKQNKAFCERRDVLINNLSRVADFIENQK